MSELPKGWVSVPLNKIIDKIVGGGTPSKSVPSYYQGNIPWMTVKDMNKLYLTDTVDHITQEAVENSSTNIIPAGTPIIATRMSLGKIVRASFHSAINQDLKALFVNRELNDYYFEYWYRSQGMKIQSLGTGTTVKGVRLEVINALEFPLAPLAEQKRIVAKLDEVLAQVDTIKARLNRIPAILKRFRQSVLAAAVSGKLTEEWRGNDVFSGYPNFELKELAEHIVDCPHSTPQWVDDGKYCVRTTAFKPFKLDLSQQGYVTEETYQERNRRLTPQGGDILYSREGAISGIACQIPAGVDLCLGQRMVVIRSNFDNDAKYLTIVLNSEHILKILKDLTIGSAAPRVNMKTIKQYPIPKPELSEQKEIVRLVDQYFAFADSIETQVKKAQARVDNLTQSILAKAFRGELVAQDPNDEPADKLLERIAQARIEAEALAKTSKKAVRAKNYK